MEVHVSLTEGRILEGVERNAVEGEECWLHYHLQTPDSDSSVICVAVVMTTLQVMYCWQEAMVVEQLQRKTMS